MQLYIDADACPVTDLAVRLAKGAGVFVTLVCDTAHQMNRRDCETVVVDKGADSADFVLVNLLKKGDLVVTQDYGLAAMALSRGAFAVNQNGLEYTAENIDALLLSRHTAKKIRSAGGRLKGPPKRTPQQDEQFAEVFEMMLRRIN